MGACAGDSAPYGYLDPYCPPPEQQISSTIFDYGEDVSGGPATPDVALREFVGHAFPRLADADFVLTGATTYTYTDDTRGQMVLRFEKYGDSWGISTTTSCAALEEWARAKPGSVVRHE